MNPFITKKRIVIIGAGFAGLNVAKILKQCLQYEIIIIDKLNHHLFQPLLYQVATAALSPADIAIPVREIFRKYPHITTLMATVVAVNKAEKKVYLENNQHVNFDYLIIAPGSRHCYFGKNHWEAFAPGLKTLQDAVSIRERILAQFELAERLEEKLERQRLLTFIIVGGGPTGVEMAGAIAEIAHYSLKNNYRHINLDNTKIYLIEGATQLLSGYPKNLASRAQRDLEKKGVVVKINTFVTNITNEGAYLGEDFIPAGNVIWAAGNEASPILKTLEVELDKQGRVLIEKDLSILNYPDIFVLGDAACCKNNLGLSLPAIAPVAAQQGKYVGEILKKNIAKKERQDFHYVDRGMMATIGKYDAIVLSGPFKSVGFMAWLAWCLVHIYFLIGYRTKFFVFIQWVFYFLRGARNIRLIFKPLALHDEENK